MSFRKEYLVKRPIGNSFYIYKRDGEYDVETKNTRSLKETYVGKLLDIENGAFIYINGKAVKQSSLHSFLSDNSEVYLALLGKCRKHYSWRDTDRNSILKLGKFLLTQEAEFYLKAHVSKQKYFNPSWNGFFSEIKIAKNYLLHYEEDRMVSIEIVQSVKSEKREIKILEYINDNIITNIRIGKLKDFILILNKKVKDLKASHSGSALWISTGEQYIYSDLDMTLDQIESIINEYELLTRIIKNIESLLISIARDRFDQEYTDKVFYLIMSSYYINRYIIDHVDKNTIREIRNNPFPLTK
ncbi:MAG: hypothetical protein PF693_00730 [Spirochaetia bacterium]|jgi:hypothetical protein|nr:hypothetical protein [Spirochaetia bacterium]